MEIVNASYVELAGTSYEIGRGIGERLKRMQPEVLQPPVTPVMLSMEEEKEIIGLLDRYCPGVNEEIQGFADALEIEAKSVIFYALTYLKPRCSQITVLPSKTANGHLLMARNYEFNDKVEGFEPLYTTKVKGKYAHLGIGCAIFGRTEGINECGLGITMSSAGFPVTNMKESRNPAFKGLQFWAVIRGLLENCKDIEEAKTYMKEVPIAYNINLIVADKTGKAMLFETLDGRKAWKCIDGDSNQQFIHATNHVHLEELVPFEPKSMRNSIVRYELIKNTIEAEEKMSIELLKHLLGTKYPNGLTCHYYDDFFGTLRSVIFDVTAGNCEICFGSPVHNPWYHFEINHDKKFEMFPVKIEREKCDPSLFEMI